MLNVYHLTSQRESAKCSSQNQITTPLVFLTLTISTYGIVVIPIPVIDLTECQGLYVWKNVTTWLGVYLKLSHAVGMVEGLSNIFWYVDMASNQQTADKYRPPQTVLPALLEEGVWKAQVSMVEVHVHFHLSLRAQVCWCNSLTDSLLWHVTHQPPQTKRAHPHAHVRLSR